MTLLPVTLALNAKSAAVVAGALALTTLSSYGLGYLKGTHRAVAAPVPQVIESRTETAKSSDTTEKSERRSASDINEDVTVIETKAPPKVLADGSIEQRTHYTRKSAKEETIEAVKHAQADVQERVVEKRVEVPCPPVTVDPWARAAAPAVLPRWMAGPSVARDFSIGKTVYGGSLAVRAGPVWFRAAVDSHPQAGLSVEVYW